MQEMITLKKNRPPIWQLLAAGALSVAFYFAQDRSLRHYMTGALKGTFSGGEQVLWYTLTFLSILITMIFAFLFLSVLSRLLLDREAFVAVRKSSMENAKASALYKECRKKTRRIRLVNDIVSFVIVTVILMAYVTSRNRNNVLLLFAVILVVFLMSFNPVVIKQKKKAAEPINRLLAFECDPVTAYDVEEHFRLDPRTQAEKESSLLRQAVFSLFSGDYHEMNRKLSQCGRRLYGKNKMIHVFFRGIYALDTGDRDAYQACFGEMNALESGRKLAPADQKLMNELRREWQLRLSLTTCPPQDVIPAVMQQLSIDKTIADRMDHTFQLGWLQLQSGEIEEGRRNLQIVASSAGTMSIRKEAQKLLG